MDLSPCLIQTNSHNLENLVHVIAKHLVALGATESKTVIRCKT